MSSKYLLSFALCLLGSSVWAEGASFRENVELRRISEYWQEKEYAAAKQHILLFLQEYPSSEGRDALLAMLGDLYMIEKNYKDATHAFAHICSKEIKTKIASSAIHCFYMLGDYDNVIAEGIALVDSNLIPKGQEHPVRFELAHALFLHAQKLEGEAKTKQLSLALQHFELLNHSPFADKAALHSAQIHSYFAQHKQAALLYRKLAEKIPEKQEEYYLLAAEQELHFDRPSAILSYEKVVSCDGTSAPLAAYNQLLLLFQEGLFADVLTHREKVEHLFSQEQLPMIDYFTGKSLYMMGEREKCQAFLLGFLSVPGIDPAYAKNALLTLLQCTQEQKDLVRYEKILEDLKRNFPLDQETAKAMAVHAHLTKEAGNAARAIQDLKEIAQEFPQYGERDVVLFDLATLYASELLWEESIATCHTFLHEYPDHPKKSSVMRHLVHSSLNAAKEGSFAEKERLAHVLSTALQLENIFNDEERQKARFFLAQAFCEIDKYDEALLLLADYLRDYASDPNIAEAHVCAAIAYQKTENFPFFVFHMEKALALCPENKELHIHLFNAYLSLSEKAHDDEKEDLLTHAAQHLLEAIALPPKPDNLRWLAHFSFQQYKKDPFASSIHLARATQAIEQLLLPGLTPDNESDTIQLAEWYGMQHRYKERTSLLRSLKELQERSPHLAWQHRRLITFKLAHSYQEEGALDEALSLYAFLIDSSDHTSSYFATGAMLDRVLLQFDCLAPEKKCANSKEVQTMLDTLKEISIARRLYSEPFHLEAAFHYIDLKTKLIPKEKQSQYALHLFTTMRESFSNGEDAFVQEYLSAKEEFPEKYALYLAYMDLVDMHILVLSSQIAAEQGDADRAAILLAQANEDYGQLLCHAPSEERFSARLQRLEKDGILSSRP